MNVVLFNESIQEVIHIAKSIARENYNATYDGAHILQALMHKNVDLYLFLERIGKDPSYFYEWAEVRMESYPKTAPFGDEVVAASRLQLMWENAEDVRNKLGFIEVTPICVLASLVKPNTVFTAEELKSLPLREAELFRATQSNEIDLLSDNQKESEDLLWNHTDALTCTSTLEKYGVDLIENTRNGKYPSLIGREKEIRNLIEILGRKSKSNVLLVGEPGVGKTTLIEGLAMRLGQGSVPALLKNRAFYQIDLSLLVAGTSYRGEVEDRLKKVLTECKQLGHTLLFIEEIHLLLDQKGSLGGVANLLKPDLARGELTVIGTTTIEEYRKIIEPDLAFNRRFERLDVIEPDEQTCVKMLLSIVEDYEYHHGIEVEPEALTTCVALAKRYAKDKKLPDTALDLLDRTMAAINLLDNRSSATLMSWKNDYDFCFDQAFVDEQTKVTELVWLYEQLKNSISPILWGLLSEQPEVEPNVPCERLDQVITSIYVELMEHSKRKIGRVSSLEIAAVMAAKTGIPLGKIQVQEKEKLLAMEELLGKRVVGQQHALKVVSDAILENRSGLNKLGQPIGSFFFLGPTGTGKTELAKAIASLLFNDEKAMIRFDMSEFKEEHAAALLYGAPPGYVGYQEGGMLVNKIRQQPYAVVLFDEIEKAHPSVFDVFLQLMDEGKIHDKLGKEGDFSNALILFTSNIASEPIRTAFGKGDIPSSKQLMELMQGHFRPEFLGRITEIVPFGPITETMAEEIFSIQLNTLIHAFNRLNIAFEITDLAKKKLAISGFTSQYGARQINGVIRQEIARPISKMIVREQLVAGEKIKVDWQGESVVFQVVK